MTLESHRKIESTLSSVFRYNNFTYKYEGDNIELKQILNELEVYMKYIKRLRNRYGINKNYSMESIIEKILLPIAKDNYKFHIQAFYESLKYVKEKLEPFCEKSNGDAKNNDITVGECPYIKGILSLLNDLIIDFNEIYWQIEEHFLNNPQDRKSGVRRVIMGREILYSSIDILIKNLPNKESYHSAVSIFLLRQTIEISILRALNICYFIDNNGKEQKFKIDDIFDFIQNNKKYIKIPVSISLLEKIINWSNFYIHKGVSGYHWQIIMSQLALIPLHRMSQDDKNTSIHGIQINKNFYYNDLEPKIKECLKLKDAQVIRFENPECLLTDNVFE